jgi:hypothetical protein
MATNSPTIPGTYAGNLPGDGGTVRGWIVKATGVLVVLPALLNSGYDVYSAAMKLPRTDAERVNSELYKKYFNKAPLATLPVPIKHEIGTVDVKFAIYEEGEVLVEFGRSSQWFPFPKANGTGRTISMSLLPSAFAQAPRPMPTNAAAIASQKETLSGSTLLRWRIYQDGRTENRKIDIRTGETLEIEVGKIPKDSVPVGNMTPPALKIDTIDLQKLRKVQ